MAPLSRSRTASSTPGSARPDDVGRVVNSAGGSAVARPVSVEAKKVHSSVLGSISATRCRSSAVIASPVTLSTRRPASRAAMPGLAEKARSRAIVGTIPVTVTRNRSTASTRVPGRASELSTVRPPVSSPPSSRTWPTRCPSGVAIRTVSAAVSPSSVDGPRNVPRAWLAWVSRTPFASAVVPEV